MNERELQLFRNRLLDLSRQCEDRNVPTHSYFLTVEEQRFAAQCLPNVAGIRVISDGVFCDAERKVLFFLPSYLEEPPEDELICLELAPRAPKFAEPLGHRDFLGALMGLGIRREMLGDLTVTENKAQLVALPAVKALIERELTEVRHTRIEVRKYRGRRSVPFVAPKFAASMRLPSAPMFWSPQSGIYPARGPKKRFRRERCCETARSSVIRPSFCGPEML